MAVQQLPTAPTSGILKALQPLGGLPLHTIAIWALVAAGLLWAIYTVVISYHWLRYSHGSVAALPAIVTHVIVSALLATLALSALITL